MSIILDKKEIQKKIINGSYTSGRKLGLSLGQGIAGAALGGASAYLINPEYSSLVSGATVGGTLGLGTAMLQNSQTPKYKYKA